MSCWTTRTLRSSRSREGCTLLERLCQDGTLGSVKVWMPDLLESFSSFEEDAVSKRCWQYEVPRR